VSTNVTESPSTSSTWAYLRGMECWTGAVLELLAHAAEVSEGPALRGQLIGARDDAEALRDLLHTATRQSDPNANATATIESICALWDVTQPRFERLAATAAPEFHQLWQARTAMARMAKHGPPASEADTLPFSG